MTFRRWERKSKVLTRVQSPQQIAPGSALSKTLQDLMIQDAFQNKLARTGYGTANLMEGTQYPLTRLTQNYMLMNSMYRNSWLARRIIDLVPKDMLKSGWTFECDLAPEETMSLHRVFRRTRLFPSLRRGLNWGRLYGGAAALMMIEGQEDQLEEPLDLDSIMPGDFKGLLVVDRWSGIYPSIEMVDDISNPEFGLPKYYEFRSEVRMHNAASTVARVHHSRIIRFVGDDLPDLERQAESYWSASKIENVMEELKKRDNTSANIAMLVFQANLKIFKMDGLEQVYSNTDESFQRDLNERLELQNILRSSHGTQIIGKDDDFQSLNYTFAGLNDIYESFMLDVSGAAQIPVTKLFGRSPAGFNSTGENDLRNYYDVVEDEQESHLRPVLDKLLPVICMSELGYVPDDLDYDFNPVSTPSEKELAELVKSKGEVIFGAHDRGLISDQTGLRELKQLGDNAGMFTYISDEEINAASAVPGGADLSLPDLREGSDPNRQPEE